MRQGSRGKNVFSHAARKFAYMSREPFYAVSESYLVLLHVCKLVLQKKSVILCLCVRAIGCKMLK